MEGHEYTAHLAQIQMMIILVADIPVVEMQNHLIHIHSVAPILDPTAYRAGMGNLEDQAEVLRGLAPFVRVARKIRDQALLLQPEEETPA